MGGVALLLAQDDTQLFLGDDFMPWMVLAFGAALVAGNGLALLRPPRVDPEVDDGPRAARGPADGAPPRPPLGRSLVMIGIGLVAAGWALASLLT